MHVAFRRLEIGSFYFAGRSIVDVWLRVEQNVIFSLYQPTHTILHKSTNKLTQSANMTKYKRIKLLSHASVATGRKRTAGVFSLITVDVTVGALTGTRHTPCPKTTAVSCNIKKNNKKLHNGDVS